MMEGTPCVAWAGAWQAVLIADSGSRGLGSGSSVTKWGAGTLLPRRKVNRNRTEILTCSAASPGVSAHATRSQPPALSSWRNCCIFDSGLGELTGRRWAGWDRGDAGSRVGVQGAGQVPLVNCVLLPKAWP